MVGNQRSAPTDPSIRLPSPPGPVWRNANPHPFRSALIALVVVVVALGLFVAFYDDPFAIPTTSERIVRQDLAALRPRDALVVKGPVSHPYDCDDGPAEASMTLRFAGGRDHAELEMRRMASQAGWTVDPASKAHTHGVDLGSFYGGPMDRSPTFFVDFTTHGSQTDARVTTVGQLGQKCGVD